MAGLEAYGGVQFETFDHAGLLAACADAVGRGLRVSAPVRDQHHLRTGEFTHDQAGDLLQGLVIISAAVARVSRRAKQSNQCDKNGSDN